MSRIVHISTVCGDDQLGDGSIECPVASIERAMELADTDSPIFQDGVYATTDRPAGETALVVGRLALLSLMVALPWAVIVLLVVAAVKNPSLFALLAGCLVILGYLLWPGRRNR